jgi:hypothetical protein
MINWYPFFADPSTLLAGAVHRVGIAVPDDAPFKVAVCWAFLSKTDYTEV